MGFTEKLNKKQNGSVYVIEEIQTITDGKYEGYLEHDNIDNKTIRVFTGSKLTGEEIKNVIISIPEEMPWRRYIKVFSDISPIYITYETEGDTVEADDINDLQDSLTGTQTEVSNYKMSNDSRVLEAEERINVVENNKAEKTYVDTELNKRYVKEQVYTKDEVLQKIEDVINAAPEALDTLSEIADALNNDPDFAATITNQLAQKVDKVSGKGLSTEDYTTIEKSKLAGIQDNATKNDTDINLKSRVNHTGTQPASTISDFANAVKTTVLSGLSLATNAVITTTDTILTALGKLQKQISDNLSTLTSHINNKSNPHTVTKSQLGLGNVDNTADIDKPISDAVQTALDGKVDDSQVLTNVPANAKFTDTVYTHPTSGVTAGTYKKVTVNAQGHVTAGENPTTLSGFGITDAAPKSHVGSTGTAHGVATSDVDGFMSSTDKVKIDTVESNANNYTHPASHPASMITQDSTHRFVADTEKSTWNTVTNKVDKVSGKGLSTEDYTTDEKTKLAGIEDNANNYTHPSSHPASMITGLPISLPANGGTSASCSGNSATATKLQTVRKINGVNFDGTADITVTANPNAHTHDDRYYTESEADTKFATKDELGDAGYGDMMKSVFATNSKNGDGYVDKAILADGVSWGGITGKPNITTNNVQLGNFNLVFNSDTSSLDFEVVS